MSSRSPLTYSDIYGSPPLVTPDRISDGRWEGIPIPLFRSLRLTRFGTLGRPPQGRVGHESSDSLRDA